MALDAVIADVRAHPVDRWVCLGDALQGGPQPCEVIGRLRELGGATILGNADAFVLQGTVADGSSEMVSEPLRIIRDWTAEEIGDDGMAFIRSFVPTEHIELADAGSLLCFHGTPASYDEVLLPETPVDELSNALGSFEANVFCGGHTHLQWTTTYAGKTYFNPGSVGFGYNRHRTPDDFYLNPFAEFAIICDDGGIFRLEFCKVPFDIDAAIEAIKTSGRPLPDRDIELYERSRRMTR